MNRRATLSALMGKKVKKQEKKTAARSTAIVSALDPYTGPWEFEQAAHLLRRTMFGPNYEQIQSVVEDGLEATISQLLAPVPMPAPPINYYFEDDPDVAVGETWVNASQVFGEVNVARSKSLEGWTVKRVLDEGISLTEKMTFFWHNHFVTAGSKQAVVPRYNYISTIRNSALGNFRELTKAMTINPLMLSYLNGNVNTKTAPNENYARELLELFTVGKGSLIGPGDYTNYTENDIAEIARVLTGWSGGSFIASRHDTGDKQLSEHFGNAIITDAGAEEYSNLINIIFQQDETAKFICRNIYRWFVHYKIDDDIELNVIEPLAQVLIDNDYEIASVLQTLFSSSHFYEEELRGCMIKNPWDFATGIIKQFNVEFPTDPTVYYETYRVIFQGALGLQMEYYNPPDVAGWKPYYQSPTFYRIWLNSATLPIRNTVTSTFTTIGLPLFVNPGQVTGVAQVDYLAVLNSLSNPSDVNEVIADFIKLLFPKDIADNQKLILKNILINGLPDFEWTVEYSDYISDPTNMVQANAVKSKINNLVAAMVSMPEYQLM